MPADGTTADTLIPPGPFISPGGQAATGGLWLADFTAGSPEPPPLGAAAVKLGTPYLIGTNTAGGTAATQVITISQPVNPGDTIVVGLGEGANAGVTIAAVTDSQGNSYTFLGDTSPIANYSSAWICAGANPLGLADTITTTWTKATTGKNAVAVGVPGTWGNLLQAVDQVSVLTQFTGTNPSITTGQLSQVPEVAVLVLSDAFAGGAPVLGGGFIQLNTMFGTGAVHTTTAYKFVTSPGPVTASATILSAAATGILITLRPAAFADNTTGTDSGTYLSPGPFISPGPNQASADIWQPDYFTVIPQPGAQDPSTGTDSGTLLSPGPFISPGPNQASMDIWQPDFSDLGQPPPLVPLVTDQTAVADFSQLIPPGPFISPANLQPWLPDFYDGGQPPPLAGTSVFTDIFSDMFGGMAVPDPTAYDGSAEFPPGMFISPATGWAPEVIARDASTGAVAAPVLPDQTTGTEISAAFPPGIFISPATLWVPPDIAQDLAFQPPPPPAALPSPAYTADPAQFPPGPFVSPGAVLALLPADFYNAVQPQPLPVPVLQGESWFAPDKLAKTGGTMGP